mmetsp:Transcript_43521/g.87108  ORF Transcript_43521/g.87108 Transcript_43521/m.87108 type:complete len:203 (+) Transcript_43521:1290-1898(+)
MEVKPPRLVLVCHHVPLDGARALIQLDAHPISQQLLHIERRVVGLDAVCADGQGQLGARSARTRRGARRRRAACRSAAASSGGVHLVDAVRQRGDQVLLSVVVCVLLPQMLLIERLRPLHRLRRVGRQRDLTLLSSAQDVPRKAFGLLAKRLRRRHVAERERTVHIAVQHNVSWCGAAVARTIVGDRVLDRRREHCLCVEAG